MLPDVLISTAVGAAILPGRPGAANVPLPLPYENRLLGARLHAQWLLARSTSLATTNALDLEVSAYELPLDAAVVAAPTGATSWPSVGRVDASVVPVLQLDYRR